MNEASVEILKTKSETEVVRKNMLYLFVKRTFDIVMSLISLILLSPLFLITIILIKLDSKGKATYTQDRVGYHSNKFKMYKFRTMIPNADEKLKELMENDPKIREEYTKYKKLDNDPRITKIGNFLRKTSIDELPQLLNILKGEMSFVGNRPEVWRDYQPMGKYRDMVTSTKPGLTGLWQVTGRSDTTFEERLQIGCKYSKECSLWLDIKIFFSTVKVVFKGEGAK